LTNIVIRRKNKFIMTRRTFRAFRWRLRLLALLARETGDPADFLASGIMMWEPAAGGRRRRDASVLPRPSARFAKRDSPQLPVLELQRIPQFHGSRR